jgi:uncharacterized protein YfaP (DUF2135 family)
MNRRTQFLKIPLVLGLALALAACPGDDDDETTDSSGSGGLSACQVEAENPTTSTIIPEITYTEINETTDENGDIGSAQSITTNTIISGDLDRSGGVNCVDAGDCDDYYSLGVEEGDEFIIQLNGEDANNFDLYLYNGSSYVTHSEDSTSNEKLVYTVPSGMSTMNIHVLAYSATAATYTLKVTTPAEPIEVVNEQGDECKSNMQGAVKHAITDATLEGAVINLRAAHDKKDGDIAHTITTGSDGSYSFIDLTSGYYTAEVVLSDYATIYQNLTLEGKKTLVQGFSMSPTLDPGQIRIVLTWGDRPNILDSYLEGPASGGGTFRINYQNMDESSNGASLDRDDTNAYGPETITITNQNSGTYTYWVDNYTTRYNQSTSTPFGETGAIVTIYDENGLYDQVEVHTASGTGLKWTVFTMTGGQISIVNSLGD